MNETLKTKFREKCVVSVVLPKTATAGESGALDVQNALDHMVSGSFSSPRLTACRATRKMSFACCPLSSVEPISCQTKLWHCLLSFAEPVSC
jgi:hypothetical protein